MKKLKRYLKKFKMSDDEPEIIDVENYRGSSGKGEDFSRAGLVMGTMKKCRDNGMVEIKEGYTVTKRDKFGNELPLYIPDTRLVFIESIETLKMVMEEDVDDATRIKIKELEDNLDEILIRYLNLQNEEWKRSPPSIVYAWKKEGRVYNSTQLSKAFSYYNEYLLDKVKIYRKLYSIFGIRAKELNYWKEESYEG